MSEMGMIMFRNKLTKPIWKSTPKCRIWHFHKYHIITFYLYVFYIKCNFLISWIHKALKLSMYRKKKSRVFHFLSIHPLIINMLNCSFHWRWKIRFDINRFYSKTYLRPRIVTEFLAQNENSTLPKESFGISYPHLLRLAGNKLSCFLRNKPTNFPPWTPNTHILRYEQFQRKDSNNLRGGYSINIIPFNVTHTFFSTSSYWSIVNKDKSHSRTKRST